MTNSCIPQSTSSSENDDAQQHFSRSKRLSSIVQVRIRDSGAVPPLAPTALSVEQLHSTVDLSETGISTIKY